MNLWLDRAISLVQEGRPCVLVTVVATEGSTPREAGSKMLIHQSGIEDSIGGGHLEFKAIEHARAMLTAPASTVELLDFALGPSLGQCCGGRVRLMLERLDARALGWLTRWQEATSGAVLKTDLANGGKTVTELDGAGRPIEMAEAVQVVEGSDGRPCYVWERMTFSAQELYLFGAGHVGRALVHVLAGLPYRIHWFDARPEIFPAEIPGNAAVETSSDPRHDVAGAPPGTLFLVMTHSHALDFDICDQVLRGSDFQFLGLIGSATKRATFVRRLALRGHSQASIRRLICPIGLPAVAGKAPAAVAISVAGQLLSLSEAGAAKMHISARRKKA